MLLGTLCASLLGSISAKKRINRAGEGIVKAGFGKQKKKLEKQQQKVI